MMTNLHVTTGIDESIQESSHMNGCLQSFGEGHAMTIAVHLPDGAADGVDPNDQAAVKALISRIFASAIDAGCEVDVQVGRSRGSYDGED